MPAKPFPRRHHPLRPARLLLALGVLLALAAGGHALVWRWMAQSLDAGFAAWASARRAQGWRVEHAAPVRGGWPLSATLTLPGFRLDGGAATLPGGLTWRAEALTLEVRLPRPDRLLVRMPGRHWLRLGAEEWPLAADRLWAEVPVAADVLPGAAVLAAERLRLGGEAGAVEIGRARIEVATRTTATESEAALSLRGSAEMVALPGAAAGAAAPPLGRVVQSLGVALAISGPLPPGRAPAERAEAWRDGGGTLSLQALDLRWGPVSATATATLTLDEALQPMGAGSLRLVGGLEAAGAAEAAGLLGPRGAAAARTAWRLFSRSPAEGGPAQIELPLTLEERVLTVARIPLAQLPAWGWPRLAAAPR